jgi:hypothetical protein
MVFTDELIGPIRMIRGATWTPGDNGHGFKNKK